MHACMWLHAWVAVAIRSTLCETLIVALYSSSSSGKGFSLKWPYRLFPPFFSMHWVRPGETIQKPNSACWQVFYSYSPTFKLLTDKWLCGQLNYTYN